VERDKREGEREDEREGGIERGGRGEREERVVVVKRESKSDWISYSYKRPLLFPA
jgi:hypothetical protein